MCGTSRANGDFGIRWRFYGHIHLGAALQGMKKLVLALMLAGCATDYDTGEVESASTVYDWSSDVQIAGATSAYQVGLASNLMVRNVNGTLQTSRYSGGTWSSLYPVPSAHADYGPALVVYGGDSYVLYHAQGENRLMMSHGWNANWSVPVTAGSTIGSATINYAPAAVVYGSSLYAGYCTRSSTGDAVRIDRYDGTTWTKVIEYTSGLRCKHVTLGVLPDGKLDILANFESGFTGTWFMYEWRGTGSPQQWWARGSLSMKSKKPMSIVTCDGVTHLVHGGNSSPNEIWWTVYENGDWVGDTRIPNQASSGGAALGCYYGGPTLMVHNGTDANLWFSTYEE
jgi:hypothetical protein